MFVFKKITETQLTILVSRKARLLLVGDLFSLCMTNILLIPQVLKKSQKEILAPSLISVQASQSRMQPVQVATQSLECCFSDRASHSASPFLSYCSSPDTAWCLVQESLCYLSQITVCLFLGLLPVSILVAGDWAQLPASVSHTDSSCWNLFVFFRTKLNLKIYRALPVV